LNRLQQTTGSQGGDGRTTSLNSHDGDKTRPQIKSLNLNSAGVTQYLIDVQTLIDEGLEFIFHYARYWQE
jgi:hypothetical protein